MKNFKKRLYIAVIIAGLLILAVGVSYVVSVAPQAKTDGYESCNCC